VQSQHQSSASEEVSLQFDAGSSPRDIDWSETATLSLSEAAKVLGIHRSTAWDLYKRGQFPIRVLRVGGKLLVSKVLLRNFLLTGDQFGSVNE
jgi:excisionase family DNA binding protein